jgi:hypothetical protein
MRRLLMASERKLGRRKVLMVAGAAGLGILGLVPSRAAASSYPRLDKAIEGMKDAKKYLEKAPPKFGGHKKKAIEALDEAIVQLEKAIEFADKNG